MSEFNTDNPMSEADIEAYYDDCKEKIAAGVTVWVRRNFYAEHGEVYDLFSDGAHQGYIEHDGDDNTWEAYRDSDVGENGPQLITPEPVETREMAEQSLLSSLE